MSWVDALGYLLWLVDGTIWLAIFWMKVGDHERQQKQDKAAMQRAKFLRRG